MCGQYAAANYFGHPICLTILPLDWYMVSEGIRCNMNPPAVLPPVPFLTVRLTAGSLYVNR